MLTSHLPRVRLAHLPTPLDEMKRLRAYLGEDCPRLFIKRDDQTGLATGGNKVRKLEFLIAEALQQGADTLITAGGAQSNHCRQTAAAAAQLGLGCVLVLGGDPVAREHFTGNLLLADLLGAEIRWTRRDARTATMNAVADELRASGAQPYIISVGGSVALGAAAYVAAVEELAAQLGEQDAKADRMILVTGSGGTHAGVLVGARALGWSSIVEGMKDTPGDDLLPVVEQLAQETAALLNLDLAFSAADFNVADGLGQHGYGVITEAEREAIRLLARAEGIILDPVYTARSFGEMVRRIRAGRYSRDETLVFWHTGGVAGLFARAAELV